jgi:hypothetical protein
MHGSQKVALFEEVLKTEGIIGSYIKSWVPLCPVSVSCPQGGKEASLPHASITVIICPSAWSQATLG